MPDLDSAAVIVAAGRGERAGSPADGPKQYRSIGGRAVLARAIEPFLHGGIDPVVVVIHPDDRLLFQKHCATFADRVIIVDGASTRQGSVFNGLQALEHSAPGKVLIHDGARPFVDAALIRRVSDSIDADFAVIPALPVTDTLKRVSPHGLIEATVAREGLVAAQTPQGFPFAPLLAAHAAAAAAGLDGFTDDAAIAEWAGMPVRRVDGSSDNVKLTLARDIALADQKLTRGPGMIDVRTGNGYDVHQLVPGDHVTLCGVEIPHDMSLLGHSDADVGLHALTDALLATCGEGDIGTHFPPSDPQWRGAASRVFVRRAVEIVAAKGGRIANVDISLICEAPKIAPHRDRMRSTIAEMAGLDLERVSVKATTNETIGFVGRREGIAAIATASVIYGGD